MLNDKGILGKKKEGEERKEGEGTHYNIYVRARKGEGTAEGRFPCRRKKEHGEATGYGDDTGESTEKKRGRCGGKKGTCTTCAHFILQKTEEGRPADD